jgi:hypothetical protein
LSSGIYCSSLIMEAVRTSETSVDNHFTRQYIPEDNSEHQDRYLPRLLAVSSNIYIRVLNNTIICRYNKDLKPPAFWLFLDFAFSESSLLRNGPSVYQHTASRPLGCWNLSRKHSSVTDSWETHHSQAAVWELLHCTNCSRAGKAWLFPTAVMTLYSRHDQLGMKHSNVNGRQEVKSSMFRAVFWVVLPCKMIPDDGGSTHLWKVGRQSFYTALQPRRQLWTSYSPPWELEISQEVQTLTHRDLSHDNVCSALHVSPK